jgi:hypothetical protein
MTTAAVIYRSRTGKTRRYAEEIGAHLRARGIDATVASIGDCDMAALADVDLLLLGCWTNGLLVIAQHPDQPWVAFARDLPRVRGRVGLFTTYLLATGSMFGRMKAELRSRTPEPALELKSRDGRLSAGDHAALDRFAAGI